MKGYIDGIDFYNLAPQKYYAPPNSWSEQKKHDTAYNRIFSGEWWGSQKRDGAYYLFLKDEDGNMFLRGRSKSVSGEYLDKFDWVPHLHSFFEQLPIGTCFIGELYLPRDEQAKTTTSIMNCLKEKAIGRQQKEEDKLHYYIFDILADEGKSVIQMPAAERFDLLNEYWRAYGEGYYEWAQYYYGKELWKKLQELLSEGYEGMVITHKDAPYQPGKRPSTQCLKVKKELQDTIDCIVIGANEPRRDYTGTEIRTWPYWLDLITNEKIRGQFYDDYANGRPIMPVTKTWYNGWAGSLKLGLYDGDKLVHVGDLSGITDEIRENWRNYLNTVVEISCMEISKDKNGNPGFRHPRAVNFLRDKPTSECILEQIL